VPNPGENVASQTNQLQDFHPKLNTHKNQVSYFKTEDVCNVSKNGHQGSKIISFEIFEGKLRKLWTHYF
jgi:hypothetical protein